MVNGNVRTVRYIGTQSAEDLYRCKENGRVFIRMPCDDEYVKWTTACKWKLGYEADCPMRAGLEIRVVDEHDNVLFVERMEENEWYSSTVAPKVGKFSYEYISNIAEVEFIAENLRSYDEWKEWLMQEAEARGYAGYSENWLYDAVYAEPQRIGAYTYLGQKVHVVVVETTHRVCHKKWLCYELRSADMMETLALIGFVIMEDR